MRKPNEQTGETIIRRALEDFTLEELLRLKKGQVVEVNVDPFGPISPPATVVFERSYTVRVCYRQEGKNGHIKSVDVSEVVGKTHDSFKTLLGEEYIPIKVP